MSNLLIYLFLVILIVLVFKLIKNITKAVIILVVIILLFSILNYYTSNKDQTQPKNLTNSTIMQTGAAIINTLNKGGIEQTITIFKQKLETFINKLILNRT